MEQKSEYKCHDCGKNIEADENEIEDGVLLAYNVNGEKLMILKCNECYKSDPSLKN